MKLPSELETAFNRQVTMEFEASLVYRQLAIEMELADLPGMSAWLRHQADEEIVHANKFIDHLCDRDNHAAIGTITAPEVKAGSTPLEVYKQALAHEQKVSGAIRELYTTTEKAGDLDSRPLLNWFITEQLEEEATVSEIVGRLSLVHNDGPGLLRLDAELGARPATSTENR